jgi:serine/threonine-protein kinase
MLHKKVAIKLLLPQHASDEEMTARMMREAKAASASGHRNIVAVLDMGRTSDGGMYLVMEHVVGHSLDRVLSTEAPVPVSRAARLVSGLLAGLEAVHRKGIVHRDLKPSNLMVSVGDDGEEVVKILDFGISKVVEVEATIGSGLTTEGRVLGTPKFMSPEQARGAAVDQRTDIYAAGAILYSLITGAPPLTAANYNAMIAAILEANIRPPSTVVPSVPRALDQIVVRALARRPEDRFPDAHAFRRALQPFCTEVPHTTQPGLGSPPRSSPGPAAQIPSEVELAPEGALLVFAPPPPRPVAPAGQPAAAARPAAPAGLAAPAARPAAPASAAARPAAPAGLAAPAARPAAPAPAAAARPAAPARPAVPATPAPAASILSDTARFAPPAGDDESLELAELAVAPHAAPVAAPPVERARTSGAEGTLYRPPAGKAGTAERLRTALLVLLLVGLGAVAWSYHEQILGWFSSSPPPPREDPTVYLLVETEPRDAEVFIDGVLAVSRPVALPRSSDRTFSVRVRAKGYVSETVDVKADRTRSIRVELRRRGK